MISPIFPYQIGELTLALSVYDPLNFPKAKIRGIAPDGSELFHTTMHAAISPSPTDGEMQIQHVVPREFPVWSFLSAPIPTGAVLFEPGDVKIVCQDDDGEETLGNISFVYGKDVPLSADRIEAIKSNPDSAKAIRYTIACNICEGSVNSYVGIERSETAERDGWIWYQDLKDYFQCNCGKLSFTLKYMRENLHSLLGRVYSSKEFDAIPLYERTSIESISDAYWKVLQSAKREEDVQTFIKSNPLLLQCFSPKRIFHKAPILSKYNVDFMVLDQRGHLLLVEIEKPKTRLLRKTGEVSADLEHAISQVNSWLLEFDLNRQACLDCVRLLREEVTQVRGIVIAGRDNPYSRDRLSHLKWRDFGRIAFLTFDDLGRSLTSLLDHFRKL